MAAPFRTSVIEPWIDYNGHLNEGYFGVIFSLASDDLLEHVGFDEDYRTTERGTFYTVETHVRFLAELGLDDEVRVDMRLLGADDKRLHIWHELYRERDNTLAATQEAMVLHVDIDEVRVRPMAAALRAAIGELVAADSLLPVPADAGRAVRRIVPRGFQE